MGTSASEQGYDAVLVVSFGGPDREEDVIPFLKNVVRGKNVPRERIEEVAEHYRQFGGRSPINDCNRALISALEKELRDRGPNLPVYWGNRNWEPYLPSAVAQMRDDGVKRALAFVTSAYGSYSGCRQYSEDIKRACEPLGEEAPEIDKIRTFFNHPGFIEPMAENVEAALESISPDQRHEAAIIFTAHSLPAMMAQTSPYVEQLTEATRLVAERVCVHDYALVYQSRSGPPSVSWLEPDVCDYLRRFASVNNSRDVLLVPIGFIADHMEVVYDLDTEARQVCDELGLHMIRAATVGTNPKFISMIRELILERTGGSYPRRFLGRMGPSPDICHTGCCPSPATVRAHASRHQPSAR